MYGVFDTANVHTLIIEKSIAASASYYDLRDSIQAGLGQHRERGRGTKGVRNACQLCFPGKEDSMQPEREPPWTLAMPPVAGT